MCSDTSWYRSILIREDDDTVTSKLAVQTCMLSCRHHLLGPCRLRVYICSAVDDPNSPVPAAQESNTYAAMAMEQAIYLVLALLLPLLLLKLVSNRGSSGAAGQRLPPGPWRLPVIGSLHHLAGKPLVHRAFADIARRLGDAPLVYLKLGEVPVVVASSAEAAREVMKTQDVTFATRPWSPTTKILMSDGVGVAFAPYGAHWRQLRKICIMELLSARRVQSFRHVREEEAGRLVAAIAAAGSGEPVNVSERLAVLIADMTVRAMIGDRFSRREEFLEVLQQGVRILSGFNLGDLFPSSWLAGFVSGTAREAWENHTRSFELIECAIKQHEEVKAGKEGEQEDLLDVLLRIQKEGGHDVPFTMGAIKCLLVDLFSAGSETSATTLAWAMSELMRNPGAMAKAQAEVRNNLQGKPRVTEDDLADLKYMRLVIKETLRLHTSVPLLLPREPTEACKVLGYDVPKGTTVFVNAWAICRDPKHWDAAEEFRPERFESGEVDFKGTNFEYTPFGAGRRICPGMLFAHASMELALASLLYHFDWELPAGGELDMEEEMGIAVGRKNDLYLHAKVVVPVN
ncbi:desmethyl-deoxy-podophyllotoxin synthase-like [Hordeum vulgare subsp. vulgare]|uniref:desmethyl-deoxy-podophyllotoxin synthase-like n=1 Tax=Hordeum vulgare subsp. vulgare TaxID=112509 RepID=UPI000B4623B4|nr:desmethyl-deoxy-podophyllotoxin synthase-like [Hordeum vulgare subsp. vulgare]